MQAPLHPEEGRFVSTARPFEGSVETFRFSSRLNLLADSQASSSGGLVLRDCKVS